MQEERSSVTALQSRRVVEVGTKVKMEQRGRGCGDEWEFRRIGRKCLESAQRGGETRDRPGQEHAGKAASAEEE